MTTIAYRRAVMAADSLAYGGARQAAVGHKLKIHRLGSSAGRFADALVGIASSAVGADAALLPWLNDGAPFDARKSEGLGWQPDYFELLVVTVAGEVFQAFNAPTFTGPLEAPYFAIGSGKDFALGAMHFGASAVDAVQAAIAHDHYSGGPVRSLALSPSDA